jgi:hypothetical protein
VTRPFGFLKSCAAVFADSAVLVQLTCLRLRYGFAPGSEDGRPLEYLGAGFWRIPEDYPPLGE